MTIKIYGMPLQHNYMAIAATCKNAGIPYEFVFTNIMAGEQMKPEFVAKFPMHCLPALEDTDNGLCVTETNAILRYVARKAASKSYPSDDLKAACIVDMILDHKLGSLGQSMAKNFIYPAAGFSGPVSEEDATAAIEKMKKDQWPAVQKFITESKGPFITGSQVSIGDYSLWGHVKVFSLLFGLEHAMFTNCEGMKEWFAAVEATIGADWFNDDNYGFWKGKAAK